MLCRHGDVIQNHPSRSAVSKTPAKGVSKMPRRTEKKRRIYLAAALSPDPRAQLAEDGNKSKTAHKNEQHVRAEGDDERDRIVVKTDELVVIWLACIPEIHPERSRVVPLDQPIRAVHGHDA